LAKTGLSAEQLAHNFADLHPVLTRGEALTEAARCAFCWDAPCTRACPTGIDVPGFIRQILHDDVRGAAETIFSENILGGSCARACPTEVLCEGFCVDHALQAGPVEIARLQRYATDYASERDLWFSEPGSDTGYKVAIVGAGPAGLACAHQLRVLGHAATIFEARDVPGGLNTMGLANYKVTREFALTEVEPVRAMGVRIELDSPIAAADLPGLMAEYDAVFLGVGLGTTYELGIPGEDLPAVSEALEFIFGMHSGHLTDCEVGTQVVVVGAGNTAVDVATSAVRLGAERVTMLYRRTANIMSAFAYEYELAKADGVVFEWLAQPVEFVARDGKLAAIRCQRMELLGEDREAELRPVAGSEFEIPCDMAIKALGQSPLSRLLAGIDGMEFKQGRVVIAPESGATALPGLFAGGDCISKGAEIVNAVQEGKLAATGIDKYLKEKYGQA